PSEGQGGASHVVTFTVTDDGAGTLADNETVTITAVDVNTAPTLAPIGDRSVDEWENLAFTLSATDSDLPANSLTFSAVGLPAGATLDAATGDVAWTPTEANGGAAYPVTFTVTDDGAGTLADSETVTITVNEINEAPVLAPVGDRTVDETVALAFTLNAVDADVPANNLTFSATGLPAGATLDPATGDVAWTPTEAQGDATYPVTFTVTDDGAGALSDSETIDITVTEVNTAPVLAPIGDRSVDELVTLAFTVTASDGDVPADALAFSATGLPTGATLDSVTGEFAWTPTESDDGDHPVTFTVTDDGSGALVDSEAIVITVDEVNTAPVLAAVGDRTVDEQTPLAFTVSATDADLPAEALTFSASGLPAGATLDPVTGDFAWTPSEAQGGLAYPVTITVTDDGTGALSDAETITITVNEVNTAPILAPVGDRSIGEGSALTFTVNAVDADVPADALTFSATGLPAGATLDGVTGDFAWTPSEAQGPASYLVTFTVTDDGTSPMSDSETIAILVNETNQPPVLDPVGNRSVDELTPLTFTLTATDPDIPADALTFSATGLPAGATLDPVTGDFAWTPTEAQGPGVFLIRFTVTDDGAGAPTDSENVWITVRGINSAPVLDPIGDRTGDEFAAITFTITATDGDIPVQTMTYSATGLPAGATLDSSTGEFAWTPTETQQGSHTMTFQARDNVGGGGGLTDTETITITVNEVNSAPVLDPIGDRSVDELVALAFTVSATDADLPADGLTYTASGLPAGATLDPSTGAFSWTPTEAQGPASYLVTFEVTDDGTGALMDTQDVAILVGEVNTAPALTAIGDRTADEQTTLTFTVTATDGDLPANGLTYAAAGLPTGATLDSSTGEFTWTPTEAQDGTHPITFTVTDDGAGALTDAEAISITVGEVNVAPVLAAIGDRAVDETTALNFTVTATDADLPANGLTFSATGLPAGATLDPSTGDFSWTPTEAQGGAAYPVTFTVADDGAGALSDSEAITITANEVNAAPVLDPIADQAHSLGASVTLDPSATDPDVPANNLVFSATGLPAGLSIDPSTGQITGSPTTTASVVVTVTVTETDGVPTNLSDSETFTWTISGASVVISEFATNGPDGANDDFIELYNRTSAPIDISNWEVRRSDGDLNAETAIDIPPGTTLGPNEYYLLAENSVAATLLPDVVFNRALEDGSGIAIYTDTGVEVDAVGTGLWKDGAGSLYGEGNRLPPMTGNIAQSYERRTGVGNCVDTDDNAADFIHNLTSRNPQGSGTFAPCGTPPPFVPPPPANHIVISEFRTDGPGGGDDEFVELYNPTSSPINVNGWQLFDQGSNLQAVLFGSIPANRHFLVASPTFLATHGIVPDELSAGGIANDEGVYLANAGGTVIDAVSVDPAGDELEGAPLPELSGQVIQSYERRIGAAGGNCVDTDDNMADFFHNLASENPQTSTAGPTLCGS
ncbi:MAG: tandem-95 repeat protein, partial [Ilumatobacter sp.]|nr:tandem-95 repeat protein [Ilumatobacter sp.]